jgi:hypothetical protein
MKPVSSIFIFPYSYCLFYETRRSRSNKHHEIFYEKYPLMKMNQKREEHKTKELHLFRNRFCVLDVPYTTRLHLSTFLLFSKVSDEMHITFSFFLFRLFLFIYWILLKLKGIRMAEHNQRSLSISARLF